MLRVSWRRLERRPEADADRRLRVLLAFSDPWLSRHHCAYGGEESECAEGVLALVNEEGPHH